MYNDFYLKFADQAEADGVLFDNEQPRYNAIDIIGVIYKPTGNMIATDDGEVPEMAPIPGFHANVRHIADAPELDAYKVTPQNPVRGWA